MHEFNINKLSHSQTSGIITYIGDLHLKYTKLCIIISSKSVEFCMHFNGMQIARLGDNLVESFCRHVVNYRVKSFFPSCKMVQPLQNESFAKALSITPAQYRCSD